MGWFKDLFGIGSSEAHIKENNSTNIVDVASLNNQGIELEKMGNTDEAISVYETNLEYPATHSFERLMVLYHKRDDINNEIRVIQKAIEIFTKENNSMAERCIESHPDLKDNIRNGLSECKSIYNEKGLLLFNPYDVYKYKKRLDGLQGAKNKVTTTMPASSVIYTPESISLGEQFEQTIKLLPEFNFYCDVKDGESTNEYLWMNLNLVNDGKHKEEIWRIQNLFKSMLLDAKRQEDIGNFDAASIIYERIVGEQYFMPTPYDRLIKIYSKAKLKDEEKRVLNLSIRHFSDLKERQKQYVLFLADKYGKVDFANERISNGSKISYYGGAFELYNPFPIIGTWKKRLEKLK